MFLQDVIVVILSTFIGFVYLIIIRNFDIYEKEPISILLITALVGGSISFSLTSAFYQIINIDDTLVDSVLFIGPIKEISKFLSLIIIYPIIKKYLNDLVDGIIFIVTISLGFAIIENIYNAFGSDDPFFTLFINSIILVLGNILFSGNVGLAFYIHKKVKNNYFGITLALLIASLSHGLYYGVLIIFDVSNILSLIIQVLFVFQILLFKTALNFSKFRKYFDLAIFKVTKNTIFLNCPKCDNNIKTKEISFWKIKAGICPGCNNIVFNSENIVKLFKYYRPTFNFQEFYIAEAKYDRIIAFDDNDKLLYNTKRDSFSADVKELGNWLETLPQSDNYDVFDKPIIGELFKQIGLKYLL